MAFWKIFHLFRPSIDSLHKIFTIIHDAYTVLNINFILIHDLRFYKRSDKIPLRNHRIMSFGKFKTIHFSKNNTRIVRFFLGENRCILLIITHGIKLSRKVTVFLYTFWQQFNRKKTRCDNICIPSR